jgi:osmotically inducible protein OsmC
MAAERRADVVWEGNLVQGKGTITSTGSGALSNLPVTWASRTERSDGKTSPEELIAAAHASCYSMALSHILNGKGTPPERLETSVVVTFAQLPEGGWGITRSAITVRGRVPGIDQAAFQEAANQAKDGCPVSKALKGNVEMSVEATLQQ